ncbi:monooxygenase [Ascochyta rabiei]|uniref:Monooxygenase n=1 Tax=Didymella rabiei TaxID=5454 RepID=A0A162ZTC3_DIDRA|nr:monooxygenase [Ascochyta rabiei]
MSLRSTATARSTMHIVVIGSGIAGLSAAAILRKYPQFSITVYERRDADFKESSAALGIRANGISVLKEIGICREEIRAVVGAGYRTYNLKEEEMSKSLVGDGPDGDGALWFVFRQDLKDALLHRVTREDGEGSPVKVLYGTHVVSVEPRTGVVEFADRMSVQAYLIIGADGIHSRVRSSVIPASHPAPTPCGLSVYRFILPMDDIRDAIGADHGMPAMYNYDEGTFVAIIAAGDVENRNVVMYPCREHQQMNLACAIADSSLKNPAQLEYSWNARGSVKEMVESIEGFPQWLQRVFSRTPQAQLFQVRDQEPLPTYALGRTVLIGDAAHAMVPYQGQGANQALEDVEGLDVLLAEVADADVIPGLLQVWDSIRRPRASEIQRGSRASQANIASKTASASILSVRPHVGMKEALAQLQTR